MLQKQPHKSSSSYRESIEALEADIQHANSLLGMVDISKHDNAAAYGTYNLRAAALPKDLCGDCVQMRLSYSPMAPFFLYLIEWMDYSCMDALPNFLGLLHILVYEVYIDGMPTMSSQEKKATIREFYAVIYPSLVQLEDGDWKNRNSEDKAKLAEKDIEREWVQWDDECGICMEPCTKMVLPNCGHSLCISCFNNWNSRSRSCPFCRGSLKGVSSKDLWVLTSSFDVADPVTLARENVRRFYLYVDSLPLATPDTNPSLFDYII